MEYLGNTSVDEFYYPLNKILDAAGIIDRGLLADRVEKPQEESPKEYRPAQGVNIYRPETHLDSLLRCMGKPPVTVVCAAQGQKRQMVSDVFLYCKLASMLGG